MSDTIKKLRNILFNPNYSKDQILAYVKENVKAGEYENVINSNPALRKAKLQSATFETREAVIQRKTHGFSHDLRKEMMWILYNINQEASRINNFMNDKKTLEKYILLAKYLDAENILSKMIEAYGESLYTLEMCLLINELSRGSKENWSELSNILTTIDNPFYRFLINFYSKRIEEKMSLDNCISHFESEFQGVNAEDEVRDFLVFKGLYILDYPYHYNNYEGVTFIANIFSVFDQYLILIEILLKILSSGEERDTAIIVIKKISKKLDCDPILCNIRNFVFEDKKQFVMLQDPNGILSLINLYTVGKFEECLDGCISTLSNNPAAFETYELYCKCLISLNKKFRKTNISPLVDRILLHLYRSLKLDKYTSNNSRKLLKLSLSLFSFNLGKQTWNFGTKLIGNSLESQYALMASLCSSINNPRLLTFLPLKDCNEIMSLRDEFSSIAYKINMHTSGKLNLAHSVSSNPIQSDIYCSKYYFANGLYSEVLEMLEKHINTDDIAPYYRDEILYMVFEAYLNEHRSVDALMLITSVIVNEDIYSAKFNLKPLADQIKNQGFEKYAIYIELPIFYSLIVVDYDLYEVYVEYMLSLEEESPSKLDISSITNASGIKKVIFFLESVCTVSTLQYSLEFDSIDKAEQERIAIFKILKQINPTSIKNYDKEIDNILRAGSVRKAIKEVNQGRLFVNIESLKVQHYNNLKESFLRYKEIEITSKEKFLVGFNASKDSWDLDFKTKDSNPQLADPTFLAFKSIYLETRDKFLFSKEYGLDSCLSTNFRHGAVKNHIRSVFEKLNLVTTKLGDKYIDNRFWEERIIVENQNYRLQELLKKFSKDIDDYSNYIVNNIIQITTERSFEKRDGLFNYSTNDETLLAFYDENKNRFDSATSVIDILYTNFINHTQSEIRIEVLTTFLTKINNQYQEFITNLQNGVRNLELSNQLELLPNILKSSTDIYKELEIIAEWFVLNTTSSSSLLDIETIINASIEYTNTINPTNCIYPNIKIEFPAPAYSSLIFVFNILFNNIIEHSKLSSDEVSVDVEVFNPKNGYIEIKVSNTISQDVNVKEVENKLALVKASWNDHTNIERSNTEGGSGFDKIKRILIYEAIAKTDRFEYIVNDNQVILSLFLPFKAVNLKVENLILASFYNANFDVSRDCYKVDPELSDKMFSSHIIFALNNLSHYMLNVSGFLPEDFNLDITAVLINEAYMSITYQCAISSADDLKEAGDYLETVKHTWMDFSANSGVDTYLHELQRVLWFDAEYRNVNFDFEIGQNLLRTRLIFQIKQESNEENTDN